MFAEKYRCEFYLQILVRTLDRLVSVDHNILLLYQLWGYEVHCLAVRIVENEETTFAKAAPVIMHTRQSQHEFK